MAGERFYLRAVKVSSTYLFQNIGLTGKVERAFSSTYSITMFATVTDTDTGFATPPRGRMGVGAQHPASS